MISVVVATYNDPRRLRLCLHGLLRQTLTDFELVVVHDGGDRQINLPVYAEMRRYGREISELWLGPETTDFRLAAVRNFGLQHAHGERTLFIDGDCIVAPNVVAEHAAYANQPVLVNGARNHLPPELLDRLQPEDFPSLDSLTTQQDTRYWYGGARFADVHAQLKRGKKTILRLNPNLFWGFQVSAPTALARKIRGYDESFVGWGGEDQNFAGRMKRAGATLIGRFDLLCYHLDHPRHPSAPIRPVPADPPRSKARSSPGRPSRP